VTARRGEVHGLAGGETGLLVLTNDTWNRVMGSVGGVLVAPHGDLDPLSVELPGDRRVALVGVLLTIPHARLTTLEYVVPSAQLEHVAGGLRSVLGHPVLLSSPPAAPPIPAGPVTYPAWGQIHYGPPHRGESKRYVVVSHDLHNRTTGRPIVVRTTSQAKRDHRSFPTIEGGTARACCGDAAALAERHLRCRPGDARPIPASLSLTDMVAVARGMSQTHGL
jgi:mRNA-degrading endonuclease toxin of MazEF toxin-antitoxin module